MDLLGFFLMLVGIFFCILGLAGFNTSSTIRKMRRRGVRVEAVCVAHGIPDDGEMRVVWQYSVGAGQVRTTLTTKYAPPPVGSSHPLIYDSRKPQDALLETGRSLDSTGLKRAIVLGALVGVPCVAVGAWLLVSH
ncbi:DUF3592 domain-containing protein [Streptomyces sp. NPDC086838]|uniref:DUF3592 domain-containing protein n=1 Tax=Streptomyces sp. NPDC086838 TaxID=3365762 RepID=UPI00382D49D1